MWTHLADNWRRLQFLCILYEEFGSLRSPRRQRSGMSLAPFKKIRAGVAVARDGTPGDSVQRQSGPTSRRKQGRTYFRKKKEMGKPRCSLRNAR
jgi:hypothetical protein